MQVDTFLAYCCSKLFAMHNPSKLHPQKHTQSTQYQKVSSENAFPRTMPVWNVGPGDLMFRHDRRRYTLI